MCPNRPRRIRDRGHPYLIRVCVAGTSSRYDRNIFPSLHRERGIVPLFHSCVDELYICIILRPSDGVRKFDR